MKRRHLHIITIVALMLSTALSGLNAQNLRDYMSLNGKWYFSIGDDPDWARYHYNHFNWEEIRVPSMWEQQGFNGYDGFAWYRKEVNIPQDAENLSLWLDLGYIDDADELYLNGELINGSGKFPPEFETAYNAHRLYKLPEQHLKYGQTNVIAVRIYDAYKEGGVISGNIRLRAEINPLRPDLSLEGKWKFKTGDKSYYKEASYNDSNWDEIMVPGAWEAQGYDNYDGMAWYRHTITLPHELKDERLVILLGKIDDVDEVYVNGELIGQTGEISENFFFVYGEAWRALRGYTIPPHLYKNTQKMTIAVRVQDQTQTGGIYEGPVGIITMDKYIEYWNEKRR
ncbi:sugar-binding domain-containing protein [Carboxylicivirga marina]|uniref:Glycoside hydrolase n=1 Tax=Carboxylicivirga marina TaxID=2800988 RepID=A0ABS1HM04_9BACT|nr:sugar-binding domain-containing protein [Carboxylicivirga marina]MBK3518645.1 glycoside hydrolase [Carboxylicivirga marina]